MAQISPSTVSSAMISVSVGPANRSMPTRPIELALGLGDEGVAGPDQHVDRRDALGADRHRGHRLDAAEAIDDIGAGKMLRGDDGRGRFALVGRRAGDDPRDARHLGGDDRHMRRGDHRIFAARHVAADRIHRDILMAEHHTRQRLDLDILERGALVLGEVAHLLLREADVVEIAARKLRQAVLDLGVGQPIVLAIPIVELHRQFAHGLDRRAPRYRRECLRLSPSLSRRLPLAARRPARASDTVP